MQKNGVKFGILATFMSVFFSTPAFAQNNANLDPAQNETLERLFSRFEPHVFGNIRLRYQGLDIDGFTQDADALTVRFRGAVEAKLFDKTHVLAEVEAITALVDDFNDGTGDRPQFPVIADPDGFEINRLQIVNESIPKTRITLGRQYIALDDSRFIGTFPFRQNSQTIDAVRLETKALGTSNIDVGYFDKVRRPLGDDNDNGKFTGESYFLNYSQATPLGRFAAFHYALELKTGTEILPQDVSTQTTGARILGQRDWDGLSVSWEGSYAVQRDLSGNPVDYSADYALVQLVVKPSAFDFRARAEILGSDNGQAVQTPIATLHGFQGLADQFLTTPDDGVRDYSVLARYNFGSIGPFSKVETYARHHWFEADTDGRNYGRELDLSLKAKLNKIGFALEYANYKADSFSTDTQTVFLTTEISF